MSYLFSRKQRLAGSNRSMALHIATVLLLLLCCGVAFAESGLPLTMEQRPGVVAYLRVDPVSHATRVRAPETTTGAALRTRTATINVIYNGFTPQAQAVFQAAVDYWETQFISSVPIVVIASWQPMSTGILGSAGATSLISNFPNCPRYYTFYSIALANTLAQQDLNGATAEINATFNSAWADWYFGTDGNTPIDKIDFMSTVMHELGHGLGMTALFSKSSSIGYWGSSGYPAIYDTFVVNSSNTQLISQVSGSTTLGSQLTSNDLYWNGAHGMEANNGNKPKLYAPATWSINASIAHLDEAAYPAGNANSLMTPLIGRGESIHALGPITTGIFQDLGWPGMTNPSPQLPDLSVRPSTVPTYTGTGIYSLDGIGQTVSQTVANGVKASYYVHVQNNGEAADTLKIIGTAAPAGWSVEYKDYATNTSITSAVISTGWSTPLMSPGAIATVAVYVIPDSTTYGGVVATQTVTATSAGNPGKQDAVVLKTTVTKVCQPDLSLRPATMTSYTGIGIYNLTGVGQTLSQTVEKTVKTTYYVQLQNNGNVSQAFTITAPATPEGWLVLYHSGSIVITNYITSTGWKTLALKPGASTIITIDVIPGSTAPGGSVATQTLTVTSGIDATKQDVGVIKTTVLPAHRPDLSLRPSTVTTYTGVGVYNLTGAGQTVGLAVAASVKASYYIHLQNNGDVAESFLITGTPAPVGWTVEYKNYTTGTLITNEVTGAGWTTPVMNPATIVTLAVYVTPDATVIGGGVAKQTVSATSSANVTKQDVGVITTTLAVVNRPDLTLRASTVTAYSGSGVYNLDGAKQTVSQAMANGVKATYYVMVKNNGNTPETFTITSSAAPAGWIVAYNVDTTVITNAVTTTGWNTPVVNPAASVLLTIDVTPASTVIGGTVATQTVTVTSSMDATKQDAGVIKTTVPLVNRPDLYLRPATVTSYTGSGIYNMTGANQTVGQSIANGVRATYYVTVKNTGNVAGTFTINAPSAPSGWTLEYKQGSTVITSAVTGVGWTTPVLNPAATVLITVYITPGPAILIAAVAEQTVTVTSSADLTKQDVGIMRTTVIQPPAIFAFTPTSSLTGQVITITGKSLTGATKVTFNGTPSTSFTVVNSTTINATVPSAATSGKIVVTVPGGVATSTMNFTVLAPLPTLESFTPGSGHIGEVILLTGTNFTSVTAIKFKGITATSFEALSTTSIAVTTPEGATSGVITVITSGGTAVSATNYTVIPGPLLTSFSPIKGSVGQLVTITGLGFTGMTTVTFNGITSIFTLVDAHHLTATVPTGASTGKITITTPGGTSASTSNFTVIPAPILDGFTPDNGLVGKVVTLIGRNFTGVTAVSFNNTAASFTVNNNTVIFATVPVGATNGKITITTSGGTVTSAENFSVFVTLSLTGFSPAQAGVGHEVTIAGSGFTGVSTVAFQGQAATFTVVNTSTITAIVPVGAVNGKISVTTAEGTVNSTINFIVIPPPTFNSFTPSSALCGQQVTLTGTTFSGTTAVTFNGITTETFTVMSPTSIIATVPAGATSGKISVTTPQGTAGSITDFMVLPVLANFSFSPASALIGQVVTLSGTNFTGATAVTFSGVAASFSVQSATTITATVPSGAASGKIIVTVPGGRDESVTDFIINDLAGTVGSNPTDAAAMVWVPAGTFIMGDLDSVGSSAYRPAHLVTLSGYWIYRNEVTVAQYRAFCTATARALPAFPSSFSWTGKSGWDDPAMQQHPIVNVNWNDAKAYADWAGVRLPTEAQWEYAVRGLKGWNYSWGGIATPSDASIGWDQSKCANCYNSGRLGISTWPVGSFPDVSWCGAQDMGGNVQEWCNDFYSSSYSSSPVTNPTGRVNGNNHVLRGGSWSSNDMYLYRCVVRGNNWTATASSSDTGFRCVSLAPGP